VKGEFEKRFLEEFEHQQKIYGIKSKPPMLPIGTILNWIGEARKEFPEVIEPKPSFAGCMEYARRIKKWRTKWFGDEK